MHRWTVIRAWAAAGTSIGLVVACLTVVGNDSVRTWRDALVLSVWFALLYGLALTFVGACMQWMFTSAGGDDERAMRHAAHTVAAYVFFACWVAGNWVADRFIVADTIARHALSSIAGGAAAFLVAGLGLRRLRIPRAAARWIPRLVPGLLVLSLVPIFAFIHDRSEQAVAAPHLQLKATDRKIFLIGIDGAEWNMLRPLLGASRLPNFQRLITEGTNSPLATLLPTYSPIVWTTIATGVSEAKHGVHDFTEMRIPGLAHGVQRFLKGPVMVPQYVGVRETAKLSEMLGVVDLIPVTSTHRRVKALWNILSEVGVSVGVVNWFATWPAEPVNGYMVSDRNRVTYRDGGFPALQVADGLTFPPGLGTSLEKSIAGERDELPSPESYFAADRNGKTPAPWHLGAFTGVYQADHFAATAALKLVQDRHVQFLAVYMAGSDVCSHYFMRPYPHLIERYYEFLDRMVGKILAAADRDTAIILVSDHGWGFRPGEPFGHDHAPDGVFIAWGNGVLPGATFTVKPTVFDITPTVLALMGLPPGRDMEGRVLSEMLTADVAAQVADRRVDTYGPYRPPVLAEVAGGAKRPAQDAVAIERLRALGYVE